MPRMLRRAAWLAAGLACFGAGAYAQQRFPNIDSAQASLAAALQSLDRAPERFGGHKARAMELIRQAQQELNQAVQNFR